MDASHQPPLLPDTPTTSPRISHTVSLILVGFVMLLVGLGGGYLLFSNTATSPRQAVPAENRTITTTQPLTAIPTPAPTLQKQTHRIEIDAGETTLLSPDGNEVATFINNAPPEGEGQPAFTDISVHNKVTGKTTVYHITGTLAGARDGPIFWSALDNKLYFTIGTNGIGIYALWSSNIDGSDATFISGNTASPPYKDTAILESSPMYGVTDVKFSLDGKTVLTKRPKDYSNGDYSTSYWVMNYDGSNAHEISLEEYNTLVKNAV